MNPEAGIPRIFSTLGLMYSVPPTSWSRTT